MWKFNITIGYFINTIDIKYYASVLFFKRNKSMQLSLRIIQTLI